MASEYIAKPGVRAVLVQSRQAEHPFLSEGVLWCKLAVALAAVGVVFG